MQRAALLIVLASMAFGQAGRRLDDYALILQDPPVARKIQSRMALWSAAAQAHLARIRKAQSGVLAELQRRQVPVAGASQILVNAVFVRAHRDTLAQLRNIPGVAYVVPAPHLKPDLNVALGLQNVPAAWSAVGGAANAGARIKIGIIDSGIDRNHPGFQDPSITPPAGFPKGVTTYTNNKVIVARSYVALDSDTDPSDSLPDDNSPADRMGHGTAIAMIAAGVENTGPAATIQGVAPKAFLGNYKVMGSYAIDDFATAAAFTGALTDAVTDGMDVVTLSLSEGSPAVYPPLDVSADCGGPCDVYAQAVESAVAMGLVVVASAGNDGNTGQNYPNRLSIHTPGTAPSAITVGASTNGHSLFQSVHVNGSNIPANLQNIQALFDDGPRPAAAVSGPIRDVAQLGNDGLACTALATGSLTGGIALVQRGGVCPMSDKIVNAQAAGAIGVIIYQLSGQNSIYSSIGASNTGIPAVMIGNTDGTNLKAYLPANPNASVTLDPAFVVSSGSSQFIAPFSSRGPSIGNFGVTPTNVVKPELVAIGTNVYTATQKVDPTGDTYNASGYAGVSGTSYAVPMVAGAVALVKQLHPTWTPAQLKSAVVNTAAQTVTEADGSTASVNAVGAGQLSVGDAVNAAATLNPASLCFGPVAAGSVSISKTLTVTNVTTASANFNVAVQARNTSSRIALQVSPASLTLAAGQSGNVTVQLAGSQPPAGSYEGFITVSGTGPGAGPTMHAPFLYFVGDGVPYNSYAIGNGGFIWAPNSEFPFFVGMQVSDQYGAAVANYNVTFNVASGGGSIVAADSATDRTGIAGLDVMMGPTLGDQYFTGTAAGLTVSFDGYARPFPTINANGVVDAAGFQAEALAPGSYITILGGNLADTTQVESTPVLPISLSAVNVSFDGGGLSLPGPLWYVSPGQINVQIPWEFQGQSFVNMKVWAEAGYLASAVYTIPLAQASPGIFQYNDGGRQSAVAVDLSNNLIGQGNPAARGSAIAIYANGLGPVSNTPASGGPSPLQPLASTNLTPSVSIGGVPAQVIFSGLTPESVGLYQINVTVPSSANAGNQPLMVSVNGVNSQTVNLAVK